MKTIIRIYLKSIKYFSQSSSSDVNNSNEVVGLIIVCLAMTIFQSVYCLAIGLFIDSTITFIMSVLYAFTLLLYKLGRIRIITLGRSMVVVCIIGIWGVNMDAGMGVNPSMIWFPVIPIFAIIATGTTEGLIWSLASILLNYSSMHLAKIFNYSFNEFNQDQWFEVGSSNLITAPLLFFGIFAYFYHKKNKDISIHSKFAQIGMDTSYLVHELGKPIFRMKNAQSINDQDIKKIIEIYSMVEDIRNEQSKNITEVDLNKTLTDVIREYDEYLHKFDFQKSLPNKQIFIKANSTAIEIIIKNLILNAIEGAIKTNTPILKIDLKENELFIENNYCSSQIDFDEAETLLNSNKPGNLGVGLFLTKKLCRLNNLTLNLNPNDKDKVFRIHIKFDLI